MIIDLVQNQLECLYGIGIRERVADFIINKKDTLKFLSTDSSAKIPKELFLVRKSDDSTVEIALFLDQKLLKNLGANDPFQSLNERNLSDFCILIEGVSHFVYFLWKAGQDRPITQLELELQAEIDKFLMLFFFLRSDHQETLTTQLFDSLFEDYHLIENLSLEARDRYRTASNLASRFCYNWHRRYQASKDTEKLIQELRFFYALNQEQKIQLITN